MKLDIRPEYGGWLFTTPNFTPPGDSDPLCYYCMDRDSKVAHADFMQVYSEELLEAIQYYFESACEDYVFIDRPVDMPEMYYSWIKARCAA